MYWQQKGTVNQKLIPSGLPLTKVTKPLFSQLLRQTTASVLWRFQTWYTTLNFCNSWKFLAIELAVHKNSHNSHVAKVSGLDQCFLQTYPLPIHLKLRYHSPCIIINVQVLIVTRSICYIICLLLFVFLFIRNCTGDSWLPANMFPFCSESKKRYLFSYWPFIFIHVVRFFFFVCWKSLKHLLWIHIWIHILQSKWKGNLQMNYLLPRFHDVKRINPCINH